MSDAELPLWKKTDNFIDAMNDKVTTKNFKFVIVRVTIIVPFDDRTLFKGANAYLSKGADS